MWRNSQKLCYACLIIIHYGIGIICKHLYAYMPPISKQNPLYLPWYYFVLDHPIKSIYRATAYKRRFKGYPCWMELVIWKASVRTPLTFTHVVALPKSRVLTIEKPHPMHCKAPIMFYQINLSYALSKSILKKMYSFLHSSTYSIVSQRVIMFSNVYVPFMRLFDLV